MNRRRTRSNRACATIPELPRGVQVLTRTIQGLFGSIPRIKRQLYISFFCVASAIWCICVVHGMVCARLKICFNCITCITFSLYMLLLVNGQVIDVLRCSQLFSDNLRMPLIDHRCSIEILRSVQDVLRCSQKFTDVFRWSQMFLDFI